jgi:hypothetical protein
LQRRTDVVADVGPPTASALEVDVALERRLDLLVAAHVLSGVGMSPDVRRRVGETLYADARLLDAVSSRFVQRGPFRRNTFRINHLADKNYLGLARG